MQRPKVWKIIVFKDGRRIEKKVSDAQRELAVDKVKALRSQGIKAIIVPGTPIERRLFPPPDEIKEVRESGMLWCPYCGAWRWFKVPRGHIDAPVGSDEWFMNSFRNQEIKVCAWCQISTQDFYVCKANGIWGDTSRRRFRSRKKHKVRRRVSR